MDKINDVEKYVASMSTTLLDKCWWLDKISPDVDTVIDFGCAQADLAVLIDRIVPGKFHYIGVDNSEEMRSRANENLAAHHPRPCQARVVSDISEAFEMCEPSKTVLVLNSVLHEVFSYCEEREIWRLMIKFIDSGVKYIAIRDMTIPRYHDLSPVSDHVLEARNAVMKSKYAELFDKYWDIHQDYVNVGFDDDTDPTVEFLLKYRYQENWERESRETYCWNIRGKITEFGFYDKYERYIDKAFYIPFIRDRIKEDFGFDYNVDTHVKLLLRLK